MSQRRNVATPDLLLRLRPGTQAAIATRSHCDLARKLLLRHGMDVAIATRSHYDRRNAGWTPRPWHGWALRRCARCARRARCARCARRARRANCRHIRYCDAATESQFRAARAGGVSSDPDWLSLSRIQPTLPVATSKRPDYTALSTLQHTTVGVLHRPQRRNIPLSVQYTDSNGVTALRRFTYRITSHFIVLCGVTWNECAAQNTALLFREMVDSIRA